jgi:Xaa-Pro aminopeptidase
MRERMKEHRVDAFVVSLPPNVRYLTGFSGSHGIAVVTATGAWFLSDSRYRAQGAREVHGFRRITSAQDLWQAIVAWKLLKGYRRVGFESESVTYAQYSLFKRAIGRVALAPTRDFVEEQALTKDPSEIACIKRAVEITEQALREVLPFVHPGVRESEVAAEVSYRHRRLGADGDAFDPIVASGMRGALPHAKASEKRIRLGDFVTIDIGCRVGGYCSDLTRTYAVGRIGREQRKVYGIVLAAQREAVAAASAGMAASALDAVARSRITAEGYGRYFSHSLGHGLGLRVHERPRVSHPSKDRLEAGSVITIEPGVYLPEKFGVRIEDDVVLTSSGCTVLTVTPKELLIL